MSRYVAELDANNVVKRVVVATSVAWCQQNLGGTWAETADPYVGQQTVRYCGPGYGFDGTFPEKFATAWKQPTGANDAYQVDALVFHNGRIWKNLTPANVWEPGVSGWRDSPIDNSPPLWVQPTGAHDAYALNALVTYNGQTWKSTVPSNVWQPGVFGWVLV